jgi:hypothetical protein
LLLARLPSPLKIRTVDFYSPSSFPHRHRFSHLGRACFHTGVIFLLALLFCPAVTQAQEKPTRDISAVYAEGKIRGTKYKNEYFCLTLTAAPGGLPKAASLAQRGKERVWSMSRTIHPAFGTSLKLQC